NYVFLSFFFFSSRRRHTRSKRDWSSDVCSSDLTSGEHLPDISAAVAQAVPGAGGETGLDLTSVCLTLTPQQAKGLEFDGVIVAAPADILAGSRGLNALYVALTRPMRRLGLVHPGTVPELLADVPPRDAVPGGVGGAT